MFFTTDSNTKHTDFFTLSHLPFLIGEGETAVFVHSGVIAGLSPPLERLINGPMKEAQERSARFPELLIEDFDRICEYAYRGDYSIPASTEFSPAEIEFDLESGSDPWGPVRVEGFKDPSDIEEPENETEEDDDEDDDDDEYEMSDAGLSSYFTEDYPKLGPSCPPSTSIFEPRANGWTQDYTPVLLGHARLYAFGDQYLIPGLKGLALAKLHNTLSYYTVWPQSRAAIIELARYAYNTNHVPNRTEGKMDSLREMVIRFVVLALELFADFELHRELLEEEGEYATDLLDVVRACLL